MAAPGVAQPGVAQPGVAQPGVAPAGIAQALARLDQKTLVSCCLASRRLRDVLLAPGAGWIWGHVTVYGVSPEAARFVNEAGVREMTLVAADLGDMRDFLDAVDAPLEKVKLVATTAPRECCMGDTLARFELKELDVWCEPTEPCGLIIDAGLPSLERLGVADQNGVLELYCFGELPRLRRVSVTAGASNVLATRHPVLENVLYSVARETFEDACLAGLDLGRVVVSVGTPDACRHLCAALAGTDRIGELTVIAGCDVAFDARIPARGLQVTCADRVTLWLPAVRHMRRVSVSGPVTFEQCGSWERFRDFLQRTTTHFHGSVTARM